MLTLETPSLKIVLNEKRGLALDSAVFKKVSQKSLFGTLHHGYYDDIAFSADFYTGHTLLERLGKSKVADLEPVTPRVRKTAKGVVAQGDIKTSLGAIRKTWTISDALELQCDFDLKNVPVAPLYSGIVTLHPEAFEEKSLYYACHNGGVHPDVFSLEGVEQIDNNPVSFLVSSRYVLGNTEGKFEIGDKRTAVRMETDMAKLAMLPRVHFVRMPGTYFLRVIFSLGEVDDTNANLSPRDFKEKFYLRLSVAHPSLS